MAKPPYLTMILVNPVESMIADAQLGPKTLPLEERPITGTSSSSALNKPGVLIPKQRFAIALWLTVGFSMIHSWFSFTLAIPRLQYYYRKGFLAVSSMFWAFPLIVTIVISILSKFLEKSTNSLIPLTIAAFLNALGCAIKYTGTHRTGFLNLFIGQLIVTLAFPLLYGFPLLYSKQCPERKWLILLLGCFAIVLGAISGIILLPLLTEEKVEMKDLVLLIYRYFLWSAVFAVMPLVLIPFSVKEQKQYSTENYNSCNTINTTDDSQLQNQPMGSPRSLCKAFRSIYKDKSLLFKFCAIGSSSGMFLSLFVAPIMCFHLEAKKTWILCIVESAVILTFTFYFFLCFRFKLEIPKWLVIINNLLMITVILSFALYPETELLSLHIFLFYFLHSLIGFNCLISIRKVLLQSNSANFSLILISFQGFLASMTCFILCGILLRFSMVPWAILICVLGGLSILPFHFKVYNLLA